MQTTFFDKYQLETKRSINKRQDFIQQFVDGINADRVGTKYHPVTWPQINGKLAHLKEDIDLYFFLKKCQQARSFNAFFFYSLKHPV